jgi:hypothetical protein
MLYYYLDGLDKKGPYNSEEIRSRNLKDDTLVFAEGTKSWKPLEYFPELKLNPKYSTDKVEDVNVQSNFDVPSVNKPVDILPIKKKVRVHPFFLFIILTAAFTGISYLIVIQQKQKDLNKIKGEIEKIFKGKNAVSDYNQTGNNGILYDVKKGPENDVLYLNKKILGYKPSTDDPDNQEELKKWNKVKDLVQYYVSGSTGGFTVLHLSKDGSTFDLQEFWSGDMAYKVPENIYHPGKDLGFGYITEGYSTPTFRPTIGKCYGEAAKYLTVENEDKSYEPGAFEKIKSLKYVSSTFHAIEQTGAKFTHLFNDIYIDLGDGKRNKVDKPLNLPFMAIPTGASVFTDQWVVWYDSILNTYAIIENKKVFNNYFLIYSFIGVFLALIIVIFIKYRNKISVQIS